MDLKNINKKKRHIPLDIKRTLRQESGFGCCNCGSPILEYHHIIRWSKIRRHEVQNMMALCPTCHNSIESYPLEQQYYFKNNPYNLQSDERKNGRLIISQGICAVNTGNIILIGDGPLITANNISFLEVYINESNLLEITLNLFNKKNECILTIVKSEWVKGNIDLWDIEFISASKVLIIKEKEGLTNLKIDARNVPVIIEGVFWIDGKLFELNKKGISLDKSILFQSDQNQTKKWGIMHFEKEAFRFIITGEKSKIISLEHKKVNTNSVNFKGSNLLSACSIDLTNNNEICLLSKKTPYEIVGSDAIYNFDKYERLLKQSIETIKYFDTNITIHYDYSDFGPFSKGIESIEKKLSTLFLEKKLARLYAVNGKVEKAWEKYQEIHKAYHEFYNAPNVEEGELLLEIAKFLMNIGNNIASKECFTESIICFTQNGNFPYRLFEFGNNLFKDNELCYCNSGNFYQNCHKSMSILKKEKFPSERKIEIFNLPKGREFKITIYILKEHKTHWSINIDEYSKGYQMIYCEQHKDLFLLKININSDIPVIIRLDSYGFLPIIREFILTKEGVSLDFS